MVRENPFHLPHPGAQSQIGDKNEDFQQALRQIPGQHRGGEHRNCRAQQGGQEKKQPYGHAHPQDHRQSRNKGGGLLAAQMPVQPVFKPGGLLFLLPVLGEELGRIHQCGDPVIHGVGKVDHPADQRPAQNGVLVLDKLKLLLLNLQLAVRLADHHGLLFRAAHHDALNQGLSTAHGFEFLLLLWHLGSPLDVHSIRFILQGRTDRPFCCRTTTYSTRPGPNFQPAAGWSPESPRPRRCPHPAGPRGG